MWTIIKSIYILHLISFEGERDCNVFTSYCVQVYNLMQNKKKFWNSSSSLIISKPPMNDGMWFS